MTNAATLRSYDDVPYLDLSYNLTHPDHLAVLATLLGMRPPDVATCRVLELGCAAGFNLIPMAYSLPGGQFTGLDLSVRQIAAGQAAVAELGLTNLTLQQMDILDAGDRLGEYDYIIAHGLYSWVPPAVQERMLAICREHLAPQGVAYISFNSQPGCRMFVALHEILRYHTGAISGEHARASAALELLDTLASMQPGQNSPYDSFLIAASRLLRQKTASAGSGELSYLLHDELEESYAPLFFHEFIAQAERHGLQYLADAMFPTVIAANHPPPLAARLAELAGDTIELEQYTDFVRNRFFRRTLLCHAEVALDRSLRAERVADLLVASSAEPAADASDPHPAGAVHFRSPDGALLSIDHPVTRAAMLHLSQVWPRALPFADLLAAACDAAGAAPEQRARDAQVLSANLLRGFCHSMELVELHTHAPALAAVASARPTASATARLQARAGALVTNLWHQRISLDHACRTLLRDLDGAHDRADLLALLAQLADQGPGAAQQDQAGAPDGLALERWLDRCMGAIARSALLVHEERV